jgi:hypothetical protein
MEVHNQSELLNKKKEKSLRSAIIELKAEDDERAALLLSIYDKLEAKKYLSTLSEIRLFCKDNALELISAKSREAAIKQFIKFIMKLPFDDIYRIKNLLDAKAIPEDRTLDGWSSIILNGRQKQRPDLSLKTDK